MSVRMRVEHVEEGMAQVHRMVEEHRDMMDQVQEPAREVHRMRLGERGKRYILVGRRPTGSSQTLEVLGRSLDVCESQAGLDKAVLGHRRVVDCRKLD